MSEPVNNLTRKVLTDPVNFLAFGFGSGLAPVAPGTFGSLPGVLLAWLTLDMGIYFQVGLAVSLRSCSLPVSGSAAKAPAA